MTIKVGASILSADFSQLRGEIKKCEDAGINLIHLDIMDGHFVPNITFGPVVVEAIRRHTKLPLDAHLMIDHPEKYLSAFIQSGVDMITVHAECYGQPPAVSTLPRQICRLDADKLKRDLQIIKSSDVRAAVAISPATPLCLEEVLPLLDMVLIMSVNPGFAGQKFMDSVLPKITQLRALYSGDIGVDGGINDQTAPLVLKAGANVLMTASYFFSAPDHKKAVQGLKTLTY